MKWILVSKRDSLLQEYHLVKNGICEAIVKYNPVHHSARLSCRGKHRLFFIESTGSLTGRYLLKNEYALEVGCIQLGRGTGKEGSVLFESKKFDYKIENNTLPEMEIYESNSRQPLLHCSLDGAGTDNNFFLLSLCWYLQQSAAKEYWVEYAA